MARPHLVVRPDCGPGVGAGHLGRCLAVAQAWLDHGGTASAAGPLPPAWWERYAAEGVTATGADPDTWPHADSVVIDGYRFTVADHRRVAEAGPVAVIDDHAAVGEYEARLVVDQNIGAAAADYAGRIPGGSVLIGPRYALVRRETRARMGRPAAEPPRRLAVAMGGDPEAATRKLILDAATAVGRGLDVAVLDGVGDIGAFLSECDIVLTAAGTTVLDVLAIGRPAVVVACADNQRRVARACGERGVAIDGGDVHDTSSADLAALVRGLYDNPHQREDMVTRARMSVDGQGAARVSAHLRAVSLSLRPARSGDEAMLYEWATDPVVRAAAFNSGAIDWPTHQAWFQAKLADPDALLFIASDRVGEAIGQIRFDLSAGAATVGLSVAAPRRGEGWAPALIMAGVQALFAAVAPERCSQVNAEVKPGNERSARSFLLAGFTEEGSHRSGEREWRSYAQRRDD